MKKTMWTAVLSAAAMCASHARAGDLAIESIDIGHGRFRDAQISNGFGCHGGNVSPAIKWSGEPGETRSLMISMYDLDAPTGSGFWHWVVADIPASVHSLAAGAGTDVAKLPAGALPIRNDTGSTAYLGPCPPQGEKHRYLITVTALKVPKLPVEATATPAVVGFVAHYQQLAKATMTIEMER
ncbi:YbhB/YbcL family Raf kinase inhibitor-like protein [Paraburkholderia sp. J94]|uniref:YbhB/YbcL family Raf kinase inhibitor-like protein n=1 Tax=Paraburkholderia sp. J94 TaxID=2805441 RepID=UPI002AB05666|nr:YbhB/YbcL family Raf kinase inhibitor-like protein [Paraburkholderia sp. J94]